jgi:flagellar assembly protein FliH
VSTPQAAATEVLRGMHVEAVPVRIGRARAPAADKAAAVDGRPTMAAEEHAAQQVHEEAVRLGHAEGLRTGYEAGLRQGLADAAAQVESAVDKGVAQARKSLEEQREQLSSVLSTLQRAGREALAAAEDEMVALCYETICRVMGDAAVRPEVVRASLIAIATANRSGRRMTLHVHPDDAALLADCVPEPGVSWIADAQVGHGGCIVQHPDGALDARLDVILTSCKSALVAARAQRARTAAKCAGDAA